MNDASWEEILGWGKEQIEDIRLAGFSFLREGHYEKALQFYKVLVILNPENAFDVRNLGALYLQIGNNEQALEYLNKSLDLDPLHTPTLLNKTKALLMLNRKTEALTLAKSLLKSADRALADEASALIQAYS